MFAGPFNSQDLHVPGVTGGLSAGVFAALAGRIEKP
jgi:hypothetical protein